MYFHIVGGLYNICSNGIAGSKRKCVCSSISYCPLFLQKGCTNLHLHQQYMRMPVTPQPHQQNVLSYILIFDNLIDEKWYLSTILICIFFEGDFIFYFHVFPF